MPGKGNDLGNEPIRIGNGDNSMFDGNTVVEYCVFYNTDGGDSESISIKSQKNIIR